MKQASYCGPRAAVQNDCTSSGIVIDAVSMIDGPYRSMATYWIVELFSARNRKHSVSCGKL